ncbi:unnamed protein product [Gongylonema pulchrum]|uniref:EGF-like domain-containing protein n=1 Tax=Gongylonema pulchrum TaxID=637853 RepID=A0A3P6Q7L8_9BILA|nr:unnamed protein product [Gongylonema pulchrum]
MNVRKRRNVEKPSEVRFVNAYPDMWIFLANMVWLLGMFAGASCIDTADSFTCRCRDGFRDESPDLANRPGRVCVREDKSASRLCSSDSIKLLNSASMCSTEVDPDKFFQISR